MAVFSKSFNTKANRDEMKNYISTKLLPNPALASLLETTIWDGYVLRIISKLGKGTITLTDYKADVYFDLNFLGSMAKTTLEATLDKEFKQLGGK